MNTTPQLTDTTAANWRHVSADARPIVDGAIRTTAGHIFAKPFAEAYDARPTRRGAPPH
ncbi:MAG: hypothetical protein R2716_11900 [Microthrixaceae bacterium]